jgi:hypothetical protein
MPQMSALAAFPARNIALAPVERQFVAATALCLAAAHITEMRGAVELYEIASFAASGRVRFVVPSSPVIACGAAHLDSASHPRLHCAVQLAAVEKQEVRQWSWASAFVKGFRTPASRGRGRMHGGRRLKSLEGGNRGGVCAGGDVSLWRFHANVRSDFSVPDRDGG